MGRSENKNTPVQMQRAYVTGAIMDLPQPGHDLPVGWKLVTFTLGWNSCPAAQ